MLLKGENLWHSKKGAERGYLGFCVLKTFAKRRQKRMSIGVIEALWICAFEDFFMVYQNVSA